MKIFQVFLMLITVCIALSCTTDPQITLEQSTVYETQTIEGEPEYILGPGDTIQVTYFFGTQQIEKEYILEVGDVMDIEFYYHSEVNKRVTIRPDGKITLARKGDISAAGLTSQQLTKKIRTLYSNIFKDPLVTVTLIEFNQALKGFREAVRSDRFGQSKLFLIRPDGYVSLFHLKNDILAAGFTLSKLETVVEKEYRKKFSGITVSLALGNTNSNLVYVSGQVARPGSFTLRQPTSVSQIVSQAGIIWENAALDSIVVVSRNSEGRPVGRLVNLNKVIGEGNIGNDIMLKRFDVVYVPKNTITKVNVWIDQYLSKIVPDWVRMSFVYGLGGKDDIFK